MSFEVTWDVEKYREEHETDEHWKLRKAFMSRWKDNYPEDRLVCLARVFSNIELMGCRYPAEVMKEIATLSKEVAHSYRLNKKTRLQRTFVSASDAAEDRAKGIKREGGIVKEAPPPKSNRINFVKQGDTVHTVNTIDITDQDSDTEIINPNDVEIETEESAKEELPVSTRINTCEYLEEMMSIKCIDVRWFRDNMFNTCFGRFVLVIRTWASKLSNILASSQSCHVPLESSYEMNKFTIMLNGQILAEGQGENKLACKQAAEELAWQRLTRQVVSVLVKQQFIAAGDARVAVGDVSARKPHGDSFGTPVDSSRAAKMMKMMGWKGGGLGADSQGIAEPIKPNFQIVNRAGLGSESSDLRTLKRQAVSLMQRYIASSSIDVDLVFSEDFTKEERAALHQCAQRQGLASKSYGSDSKRFLVVKQKLKPFTLVKAALEQGGNTAKYQVFIPVALTSTNGR